MRRDEKGENRKRKTYFSGPEATCFGHGLRGLGRTNRKRSGPLGLLFITQLGGRYPGHRTPPPLPLKTISFKAGGGVEKKFRIGCLHDGDE